MYFLKNLSFIFVFLFLVAGVFSCSVTLENLSLTSGSYDLGSYDEYSSLPILPDLTQGLGLVATFADADACLTSDNVAFSLFSTYQDYLPSSEVYSADGISIVEFEVSNPLVVEFPFTSFIKVDGSLVASLSFKPDTTDPSISFDFVNKDNFMSNGTHILVGPEDEFDLQVTLEDGVDGSGLSYASFSFDSAPQLDGNKTYISTFRGSFDGISSFDIYVEDQFGNSQEETFDRVLYDGLAPEVISSQLDFSYSFSGTSYLLNINSLLIKDESFSFMRSLGESMPFTYTLDVSSFSSQETVVLDCSWNTVEEGFDCDSQQIVVDLVDYSGDVSLDLIVEDRVGNSQEYSFSNYLFYDTQGPEITRFELVNGMGVKNYFSKFDNETRVYLEFEDESLAHVGTDDETRISIDFSAIPFPDSFFVGTGCEELSDTKRRCEWALGDSVGDYLGDGSLQEQFMVQVTDLFGNPSEMRVLNLTEDSTLPKLLNLSFEVPRDALETGLIKSGDSVVFTVDIFDEHLLLPGQNVESWASPVSFTREFTDSNSSFSCGLHSQYSSGSNASKYSQCTLELKASNGYSNGTFPAKFYDLAGNELLVDIPFEIYKIGDEKKEVFTLRDVLGGGKGTQLNAIPLNRNQLADYLQEGDEGYSSLQDALADTFVEAEIIYLNEGDRDTFSLINYRLEYCQAANDFSTGYLLQEYTEIYPEALVRVKDEEDMIFPIKLVLTQPVEGADPRDLNGLLFNCSLSILKTGSEEVNGEIEKTVYDLNSVEERETIDFQVMVSFYDLPRGHLVQAHAEKILSMAEDARVLGDDFDLLNDIFQPLSMVCDTLYSFGSLWNSLDPMLGATAAILQGIPFTYGIGTAIDQGTHPVDVTSSMLFFEKGGFVDKFCSFVTCRWSEQVMADTIGLNDLNSMIADTGLCSANIGFDVGDTLAGVPDSNPEVSE